MIVTVDGPAAAGKGTLARALAARLGYAHLDTGSLYRAVAKAVLDAGGDPAADPDLAVRIARNLALPLPEAEALRDERVSAAASVVAALAPVRKALLEFQRRFARTPPGAVLDGRDAGTVVCPEAGLKLFVTASAEERARRRYAELRERGEWRMFDEVMADLAARDERDSSREEAPLRMADDAIRIDTTGVPAEQVLDRVLRLAEGRIGKGEPGRGLPA